ncbi:MAG: 4Fe-4S dicluster domain-containing protein [Eggerthellaceae bacterium]|jgi:Pyruvate/2-oxoacid:ferredoxin oxidoreductase delta subunit/coenzyme F420-reducing hydrogenase delta subunit
MTYISTMERMLQHFYEVSLAVTPEQCVRIRHRMASCDACINACAQQAITLHPGGGGLDIEPALCDGCGCCATVCPTGALEPIAPSSHEVLKEAIEVLKHSENGTVVFACPKALPATKGKGRSAEPSGTVKVHCIGRLDESVLVGLGVAGAQQVLLVDGPCTSCRERIGHTIAQQASETANTLLQEFGNPQIAGFTADIPESDQTATAPDSGGGTDEDGYSRRGFFSQMKDDAKMLAYDAALESSPIPLQQEQETEESLIDKLRIPVGGTMVQRSKACNDRLLSYLDTLGKPREGITDLRLWGHVSIDAELCTGCEMCAVFCPTGALYRADDEAGKGLDFMATDCVGCNLCADICMFHAISVTHQVSLRNLIDCTVEPVYRAMNARSPRSAVSEGRAAHA